MSRSGSPSATVAGTRGNGVDADAHHALLGDHVERRLEHDLLVAARAGRHRSGRRRGGRELDAEARRAGGRVATSLVGQAMLDEVPDLVEYQGCPLLHRIAIGLP